MSNPFNLPPDKARQLAALFRRIAADPRYDLFADVETIVNTIGIEPRQGRVANELAVDLWRGVQVSVEGRGRGKGISIVRWNGKIVLHQCDPVGRTTYEPGEWEAVVRDAAKYIREFGSEPPMMRDLLSDLAA